jgi:hypothetical protein
MDWTVPSTIVGLKICSWVACLSALSGINSASGFEDGPPRF